MKPVTFENLEKKIVEGVELTYTDKAYATGYIEAMNAFVSAIILNDTTVENKLYELLKRVSMAKLCYSYKVGDQIEVDLDGFGVFTATAQEITEDHVVFMFDDCIYSMPMNNTRTNEGGYQKSGLCYYINRYLRKVFPEEIRQHLTDISIPTYGQIFGHDEIYHEHFETDKDKQFELMKKRKNRIADYKNKPEWFWLQNATKKEVSATDFAYVTTAGSVAFNCAAYSVGVRPIFTLSRFKSPLTLEEEFQANLIKELKAISGDFDFIV